MALTQKETMLLKDMISQEKICIEKYSKYSAQACDGGLKNLFTQLGQNEVQHENTLNAIMAGKIPQVGGGESSGSAPAKSTCSEADREKDKFLCSDALGTEKHVSSVYNTGIFEFCDVALRNVLNHIQKEEQEHGEKIFAYMHANGMYQLQ